MNKNVLNYERQMNRENLKKIVEKLSECAVEGKLEHSRDQLKKLSDRIAEDEIIIAVLSQFKRGKSTFVNFILGEDILPTGVIPITSIVTKIKYGSEKYAVVARENGEKIDVGLNELITYVSEQQNPNNEKGIAEVQIYYPSDFLRNGIVLVDTPGVGSIHQHNTDAAYDYLKNADAAVFMVSADTPINEIEVSFLRHIKTYVNKIYFVLNKIDYLEEKDLATYLTFCYDTLERILNCQISHFYPISLKNAIEGKKEKNEIKYKGSRVEELFENLKSNIINEKALILFFSLNDKLLRIAETMLSSLKLKAKTLEMPLETLEEAIEEFKLRLKDVSRIKEESIILIKGKCELIVRQIEAHINSIMDSLVDTVRNSVIELYKENQEEKPRALYEKLMNGLSESIENGFNRWKEGEDKYVDDAYAAIMKDFKEELDRVVEFINQTVRNTFNIEYNTEYEFVKA